MKRKARRLKVSNVQLQSPPLGQSGLGTDLPPDPLVVEIYFDEQGLLEQAAAFYGFYTALLWRTVRNLPIRNWKVVAADWIFDLQQQQKLEYRQSRFVGD